MKKLLRSLLLVLLLAGMLSACATQTETQSDTQTNGTQSDSPQESSEALPSNADETDIDPVDQQIFDPYWQLSDTDPFLFAMRDNPIDAQVPIIMEGRYKTGDMADGLYEIYDLWVAEMESSLQQLLDAIEDADLQQQLLDSQTAWMAYIDASQPVNNRLITQDGENYGTIMLVVMPDTRIAKYRERTILLKYLLYLYTDGPFTGTVPQFLPVES